VATIYLGIKTCLTIAQVVVPAADENIIEPLQQREFGRQASLYYYHQAAFVKSKVENQTSSPPTTTTTTTPNLVLDNLDVVIETSSPLP